MKRFFEKAERPIVSLLGLGAIVVLLYSHICASEAPPTRFDFLTHDSSAVPSLDRLQNREQMLTTISNIHDTHVQAILANESNRTQSRLFFITALTAFITILFTSEHVKSPKAILWSALVFTLLLYGLDVHLRDIGNRLVPVGDGLRMTMLDITNTPSDSNYTLRFDESRFDSAVQMTGDNRQWRKVRLATTPNLEQSIYYFVPLFFLVSLLWFKGRKPKMAEHAPVA